MRDFQIISAVLTVVLCTAAATLQADSFPLRPGDDLVGWQGTVRARHEDTLADIARQFQLGHEEIRLANPGVDFWLPGEGADVVIPARFVLPRAERRGIVLNVPEMRLYYFRPPTRKGEPVDTVVTYPISIGRMDWSTPLGRTRVASKASNPSWRPPDSIRAEAAARGEPLPDFIPPGPDNPLGAYALRLGLPTYLIHGTNRPYGVGMRVTHGCIRMYPEDIEQFYPEVAVGTPVEIVNQPVKVGWLGDTLFVEVHPPLEEYGTTPEELRSEALRLAQEAEARRPVELLGRELLRAVEEQRGIPVAISRGSEM